MIINQSIVNEVKQKPIADQVRFILDVILDTMSNVNYVYMPESWSEKMTEVKSYLIQFEDIIKNLRIANKKVDKTITDDEFYQLRINEVVKMQLDKKNNC
jgi:hypothetical protein